MDPETVLRFIKLTGGWPGKVVIVAGSPPGVSGTTNALRLHRVGDAIYGNAPAYQDDPVV